MQGKNQKYYKNVDLASEISHNGIGSLFPNTKSMFLKVSPPNSNNNSPDKGNGYDNERVPLVQNLMRSDYNREEKDSLSNRGSIDSSDSHQHRHNHQNKNH